ncbi:DUF3365 domain-containing protein [Membranicola marinus]|uniref:DUF3365 domain-containing protein n=1 Tax=Membranihabitans marinus TaxID=1227546 RepID=A0A953HNA4_9BACT|nr:DUF3365 domain-containing protein [Membranihabitans marinus]MBY5958249.1 DUF3365 domain-containing protein [Membranihabitans marinus]
MKKNGYGVLMIALLVNAWNGCQSVGESEDKTETTQVDLESWKTQGQEYAMKAQQALGQNLKAALQQGGPPFAVDFCNTRAIPITDSAAQELKVSLRRVSDKYRNPGNQANEKESKYISRAKEQLAAGETIHPAIEEMEGKMIGYYPILTNAMCMNCHGQPGKDINEETLNLIKERYPDDRAVGYQPHEVRGIWVVEMDAAGATSSGHIEE